MRKSPGAEEGLRCRRGTRARGSRSGSGSGSDGFVVCLVHPADSCADEPEEGVVVF